MLWAKDEKEVMGKIERTLKWRASVNIYEWKSTDKWAQVFF